MTSEVVPRGDKSQNEEYCELELLMLSKEKIKGEITPPYTVAIATILLSSLTFLFHTLFEFYKLSLIWYASCVCIVKVYLSFSYQQCT